MIFENRSQAGKQLVEKLVSFRENNEVLILAISSGGVMVAKEMTRFLNSPVDLLVMQKIAYPQNPSLALGWMGSIGREVLDQKLMERLGMKKMAMNDLLNGVKDGINKREKACRGSRPKLNLQGKILLLVDDGVATGSTMSGAIRIARQQAPKKVVVVVPVIAKEALPKIEKIADEVIYLHCPDLFISLSEFYQDFPQIQLEEVVGFLK